MYCESALSCYGSPQCYNVTYLGQEYIISNVFEEFFNVLESLDADD